MTIVFQTSTLKESRHRTLSVGSLAAKPLSSIALLDNIFADASIEHQIWQPEH